MKTSKSASQLFWTKVFNASLAVFLGSFIAMFLLFWLRWEGAMLACFALNLITLPALIVAARKSGDGTGGADGGVIGASDGGGGCD